MAIAPRVKWYLDSRGVEYEVLGHPHSTTSLDSARRAHVFPYCVAKCVLLEDERGYLMAIVPASRQLEMPRLKRELDRSFELANDQELETIFPDCEVGAVPAVGGAYNIPTVIERDLLELPHIYFEAGDHENLVRLKGSSFIRLLQGSQYSHISRSVTRH